METLVAAAAAVAIVEVSTLAVKALQAVTRPSQRRRKSPAALPMRIRRPPAHPQRDTSSHLLLKRKQPYRLKYRKRFSTSNLKEEEDSRQRAVKLPVPPTLPTLPPPLLLLLLLLRAPQQRSNQSLQWKTYLAPTN